jgi:hypothetical protein
MTTADMKLHYTQEVDGEVQGKELAFDVTFWEAEIEVDAGLSHPCLFESKIVVFPHHKALAVDRPKFTLFMAFCQNADRGVHVSATRISSAQLRRPSRVIYLKFSEN